LLTIMCLVNVSTSRLRESTVDIDQAQDVDQAQDSSGDLTVTVALDECPLNVTTLVNGNDRIPVCGSGTCVADKLGGHRATTNTLCMQKVHTDNINTLDQLRNL